MTGYAVDGFHFTSLGDLIETPSTVTVEQMRQTINTLETDGRYIAASRLRNILIHHEMTSDGHQPLVGL